MAGKYNVFCSYSHNDSDFLEDMHEHLAALKHIGLINLWIDSQILAGEEWDNNISAALESADLILLLVSSSFIASKYCYEIEMKRAMELYEFGQAITIPIIIRPCDWKVAPFSKLHALPKNSKAISTWANSDEAWTDVAKGIRNIIGDKLKCNTLINEDIVTSSGIDQNKDNKLYPEQNIALKFLSHYPRDWFNVTRIKKWGGSQPDFEELYNTKTSKIRSMIDPFCGKNISCKVSENTGNKLYKWGVK